MNKINLLQEAEKLRDQLAADLRTVDQFLDIARRRSGDHGQASVAQFSTTPVSQDRSKPRRYGEVGKIVAGALRQCKQKYNVRDVEKALKRSGQPLSRLSITNVLRRFTTQGKIREVTPGAGRRPTVYTTVSL